MFSLSRLLSRLSGERWWRSEGSVRRKFTDLGPQQPLLFREIRRQRLDVRELVRQVLGCGCEVDDRMGKGLGCRGGGVECCCRRGKGVQRLLALGREVAS